MTPSLAIVIPVGPGDFAWQGLLPQLENADASEILLVLPSDSPSTAIPAHDDRLRVIASRAGRARLLNAGAQASHADWLWFLHADSRLESATLQGLHRFVAGDCTELGYFDLHFLDDGPRCTAINAFGAHLRSRWLGLPFGDQGFVMPRRAYEKLGGFDESLECGEDHALIWRARRMAIPIRALSAPLYTSARKYAERGWWRTTGQHLRMSWQQVRQYSKAGAQQ